MVFKEGALVTRILHGAGHTSKESATVLRVDSQGVWLDNGMGNKPDGPFVAGIKKGVFGFWEEIVPITTK